MRFGRQSAAAQRAVERREREDRAPRLVEQVPDIVSLLLEIEDRSSSTATMQPKYLRRVVVERAPALFLIPCGDPNCTDGGHDVTWPVMQALQSHRVSFDGEDSCHGSVGSSSCTRVLHFHAVAQYKDAAAT